MNINDYASYKPTWCPGCGNWGINVALRTALAELNIDPSLMIAVFGIGCSGNGSDFLKTNILHSLHGRAIPNAIGIKIANHNLPVFVFAGDGDCYGEGGNHFIHAARGNHDIKVMIHDNMVYGLTTGQVAPTAKKGFVSKSTPAGIIEIPINPLALAIVSGATFVAQTFAGNPNHMTKIIKEAIKHQGFSLINVLQPCVSFNKVNDYKYYLKNTYILDEKYQADNQLEALKKALEVNQEKFPLGIIYRQKRKTYTDELAQLNTSSFLDKQIDKNEAIFKEFI